MRSAFIGSSLLTAALLTFGLTTRVNAQSAPPNLVHFQARVADAGGNPLNGLVTVEVRAYTVPVGGAPVWSESQLVTALNGVVNLNLGSLVALPLTVFDSASVYLAVKVGADPEMTPRRQVIAVPYARRSATTHGLEATTTIPTGLITGTHILNGTITNLDIAAGAITSALLAVNSVGSTNIIDGAIATADIAASAITSALIADGSITSADILDGTITAADLAASSVTASEIATDAVGASEIALGAVTTTEILDGTIGTIDIAAGAITGGLILDGSVTAIDLAANSVGASEIATGAITTTEILDATIAAIDIATGAVGQSEIATDGVAATEVQDNSIDGGEIVDNSLTAADIANTLTDTIDFSVTGSYAITIVNDGSVGIGDGLRSTTQDASGYAVWATASNASGGYGIRGESSFGVGVFGSTGGATSSDRGVWGSAASSSAYAIYGSGDFGGTGTKYFINPHPTDPTKQVNFACLEGNESATFFRGSGTLSSGLLLVPVPEDFALVTEPDSLMVTATPVGAAAVVYVDLQSLDGIVIRGNADVKVNYMVTGTRLGHKGLETIRENSSFVPEWRGIPFGSQYKPAYRQLLVKNGILNADFTPNEATAAKNGWALKDPWSDPRAESLLRSLIAQGEIRNPRPFKTTVDEARNEVPVVQDEKALEGARK
jgi:hypothetical protein